VGAGLLLVGWALGLFRRRGTTFEPFGQPAALVTTGPYRISRNPMYLGMLLVMVGGALLAGSAPALVAPVGFVLTMNATQIPQEEAALEAAFGPAYRTYRRRVRRWL
jgi:protein-S-isoprenylcysteine O-methyltransferase Ste14